MSARRPVDNAQDFGKVAVLLGGESSEREISLITGKAVHEGLRARGVDATALDVPNRELIDRLREGGFDRVWNALHGGVGENGALQGLLECAGIPYTGSGVLASAVGLDKVRSKQLFEALGIATPSSAILRSEADLESALARLGLPMAVKPNAEGSSVGVAKVTRAEDLLTAFRAARRFDSVVLAEQWIDAGGEFTAGVLQGEVLPIIRIEAASGFYDYQAKYFSDDTRYLLPSGLTLAQEASLSEVALKAFGALGCAGWGRVDLLLDGQGQPLVLEVNTVPGMTHHSLVPMAAAHAGIDFPELVWRVLETSMQHEEDARDG
ncbi:MAG: D-alanine--D-alanine ligase [Pseudomonadota bacterium]